MIWSKRGHLVEVLLSIPVEVGDVLLETELKA